MPAAEHLTQLPEDVQATLHALRAQFEEEDQHLEQALLAAARSAQVAARVPRLCEALQQRRPALSQRAIFQAVGLFLGLHPHHVQRIFYRSQHANHR